MPVVPVESLASLESILSEGTSVLVFKHSTRCPVSARARDVVDRFAHANPDVPIHRVLVVEQRAVSLAVAERLGVPHASPQVILVRDGKAVWDASHLSVTEKALTAAWGG